MVSISIQSTDNSDIVSPELVGIDGQYTFIGMQGERYDFPHSHGIGVSSKLLYGVENQKNHSQNDKILSHFVLGQYGL